MSRSHDNHKQRFHEEYIRPNSRIREPTDDELERLTTQLKNLSERVLPKQPYLVSVPSEVPYRHSSHFVNRWFVDTPFQPDEEQLQYVSFLPHHEEEKSLLHVFGGWSDEHGNLLKEDFSPEKHIPSGRDTPSDSALRKKISLYDYKVKAKPGIKPTSNSSQSQSATRTQDPMNATLPNGNSDLLDPTLSHRKRSHSTMSTDSNLNNSDNPRKPLLAGEHRSGSPAIPALLSPPQFADIDMDLPSTGHAPEKQQLSVPKMLSPTLPSYDKVLELPILLSPTLPSSIEDLLSKPEIPQTEKNGDHRRTESVRSILASGGLGSAAATSEKKIPAVASKNANGRDRSDSQLSSKTNQSAPETHLKIVSPALKSSVRTPVRPATPLQNGVRSSPGPRQRHTIVLKYGKRNRKRVEALLKFAARPKKVAVQNVPRHSAETSTAVKEAIAEEPASKSSKRGPETQAEESSSSKRQKLSAATLPEKPATPVPIGFRSPVPQTGQPRSLLATPKKSTSMRRVESSEGAEAGTPSAQTVRQTTPMSGERGLAPDQRSPPTSAPSHRDEDRQAWMSVHAKLFALGRALKREGSAADTSPSSEPNAKDPAVSVVLLIEALICFMLNMAATSYAKPGVDPGWQTIIQYHIFVFRASRKYPHLHGIVTQLGAVCRQYINRYNMDRLVREPLPDEQCNSAPTPGSDGNTKTNEDLEIYKRKYIEFRNDLVANSKELQVAWLNGCRELSLQTLEEVYPHTWAKRSKDSSSRGRTKPTPGKIPDEFFLPLDATTNAFEAARFTLSFLEEWTKKEGVEWTTRIEL